MSYTVDFENVSTIGLESSPVAAALAGLRANEARYFKNKYNHNFSVVPADEGRETVDYVNLILKKERSIELAAKPLETSRFQVENIRFANVFYEDGLEVNVMYTVDDPKKRPSDSSFPRAWRCRRSWKEDLSLLGRNQRLPERFGVHSLLSKGNMKGKKTSCPFGGGRVKTQATSSNRKKGPGTVGSGAY